MSSPDIFCQEHEAGVNTFHENDLFRARWDLMPLVPGHAEVLPKRHVQHFEELTEEELSRLMPFVREVIAIVRRQNLLASEYEKLLEVSGDETRPYLERVLRDAHEIVGPPTAFNHGLNDGPDAGQSVPHFHYHVIPRWNGDVENPRGGIRRMFGEDDYSNGE